LGFARNNSYQLFGKGYNYYRCILLIVIWPFENRAAERLQFWYCKMAATAFAIRYMWFSVIFLARKWRCTECLLRRWNDGTRRKPGSAGREGRNCVGGNCRDGMIFVTW
jgi:hypothetical protein